MVAIYPTGGTTVVGTLSSRVVQTTRDFTLGGRCFELIEIRRRLRGSGWQIPVRPIRPFCGDPVLGIVKILLRGLLRTNPPISKGDYGGHRPPPQRQIDFESSSGPPFFEKHSRFVSFRWWNRGGVGTFAFAARISAMPADGEAIDSDSLKKRADELRRFL